MAGPQIEGAWVFELLFGGELLAFYVKQMFYVKQTFTVLRLWDFGVFVTMVNPPVEYAEEGGHRQAEHLGPSLREMNV